MAWVHWDNLTLFSPNAQSRVLVDTGGYDLVQVGVASFGKIHLVVILVVIQIEINIPDIFCVISLGPDPFLTING